MDSKNIIFLAAGFAGGCFFMKWYLRHDMEERLDEAYKEMDIAMQREWEKIDSEKDSKKNPDEEIGENNLKTEKELRIFKTEVKKRAYDTYFSSDEEIEGPEVREHPRDDLDKEPRIISYEAFTEDRRNTKISLIYYTKADILTEEDNTDIIENRQDIVGDALRTPDDLDDDHMATNFTVYVRNDRLGVDYEINFDDSDAEFVRKSLGLDG